MRLSTCFNAGDFEQAAMRRLPKPLYDYIAGGADDEGTMNANVTAYNRYQLVPRYLRDVTGVDMRRTVLGVELEWPLILAPTGMSRMFHSGGELAVARAARESGIAYSLSTMGSESIESIAAVSDGAKIYQLYLLNDDALNHASIDRAREAGFDALCLTVDTVSAGNRERDLRSGLTIPPKLTPASLMQFAGKPSWCADYLAGGRFGLPNLGDGSETNLSTLAAFFAERMERHISWDRVRAIAEYWGGPFAIKGLQCVDDVLRAADNGASAVILSNHGGRQLDGGAATIDLLPDVVDSAGDKIEIIVDGGVRRGAHIAKAVAMGARACMTGRPYIYGLAAYGEPGVRRVLSLLRAEFERTMVLLGCPSVDELSREHIRLADAPPAFLASRSSRTSDNRPTVQRIVASATL